MRRFTVVVLAAAVLALGAPPAGAYTHFGTTDNVRLSVQWSQQLFSIGSSVAIVVRSDGFADSLAAGALAGAIDAPVLLNPPGGGLSAEISNELARLGADDVLVIGGTGAVSQQAVDDLEAEGYAVQRLAGENRFLTAAAVMRQPRYDDAETVYVARSDSFADSLGAGMLAGSGAAPLVITETARLTADTRTVIAEHGSLTTAVIVGGTAAVSTAIADELGAMGLDVERVAGPSRFDTAALTADRSFDPARSRVVALVDAFDADSWTSGYPASAAAGGAVVLSDGNAVPAPTQSFLSSQDGGVLYCAPEVGHDACLEAEALLNG